MSPLPYHSNCLNEVWCHLTVDEVGWFPIVGFQNRKGNFVLVNQTHLTFWNQQTPFSFISILSSESDGNSFCYPFYWRMYFVSFEELKKSNPQSWFLLEMNARNNLLFFELHQTQFEIFYSAKTLKVITVQRSSSMEDPSPFDHVIEFIQHNTQLTIWLQGDYS